MKETQHEQFKQWSFKRHLTLNNKEKATKANGTGEGKISLSKNNKQTYIYIYIYFFCDAVACLQFKHKQGKDRAVSSFPSIFLLFPPNKPLLEFPSSLFTFFLAVVKLLFSFFLLFFFVVYKHKDKALPNKREMKKKKKKRSKTPWLRDGKIVYIWCCFH